MQFIDRAYGSFEIDDPCALAIIQSPAFDRLWRIKQNGPLGSADPRYITSRAEHCIGTYQLLRLFGASREEQLSGLVHDANHLAFSHLVDYLLDDAEGQEKHHELFADNPHLKELERIINAHGLDGAVVLGYERYSLLEQPAPALCADRIDYTFRDGLCMEQTSRQEIEKFLASPKNHDGLFVMDSLMVAERFARLSIDLHIVRESNWGNAVYVTICKLIKRALAEGVLSFDDFLGDDAAIYAALKSMNDPHRDLYFAWEAAGAPIEPATPDDLHMQARSKMRLIDPHVLTPTGPEPISTQSPGLATFITHYRNLRTSTLFMKYPAEYAALANL